VFRQRPHPPAFDAFDAFNAFDATIHSRALFDAVFVSVAPQAITAKQTLDWR
jgi:hypothetical protein